MRIMCMVEHYHVDECNVNKTTVNPAHSMLMWTAADLVVSQADRMAQAHSCMTQIGTDRYRRIGSAAYRYLNNSVSIPHGDEQNGCKQADIDCNRNCLGCFCALQMIYICCDY